MSTTRSLMNSLLPKLLAGSLMLGAGALAAAADYKVLSHYKIGGDDSRYDFITIDADSRRVYVAHQNKFEVINADTGEKLGELGPVKKAHGVAVVPSAGHGFASCGDDVIIMFDLATLQPLKRIAATGADPDAIAYDSVSARVFAANHGRSSDVTVLDPVSGEVVGTVKLGGTTLEGICFDGRGRAFVNDEELGSIHVFDTRTLMPIAQWSSAPGEGGTGLGCDAEHHRIFSACGNRQMVVLDSDSGKVVATVAIGKDPDGLTFDPNTHRIFTSNFDGTLTVVQQDSPDRYTVLQNVPTAARYRTLALDAKTGRVMIPGAKFGAKPEAVKGGSVPKLPILPGTFEILVVGER